MEKSILFNALMSNLNYFKKITLMIKVINFIFHFILRLKTA